MRYSIFNKLTYLMMSISLVIGSSIAKADDTEIYFSSGTGSSGNIDQTILPNVLFILDTSGSMTTSVPEAGGDSRITVLKDAMTQILSDAEDMNIGLGRYTSGEGGPILFPITYIDGDVGDVVSEESAAGDVSYQATISDGNNDGEQNLATNAVTLGETVLDANYINVTTTATTVTTYLSENVDGDNRDAEEDKDDGSMSRGSNDLDARTSGSTEYVGVIFNGINIPDNAVIEHAYLDFWIYDKKTTTTNITIHGFDEDTVSDFSNSAYDMSSRTQTSASANWTGVPASNSNVKISSVDLKDIVQEIVSRNCTNAAPDPAGCTYGNDTMGFFLNTTLGERSFYSRDKSSSKAPNLRIEYQATGTATAGDANIIGLRFENIKIPKDATVTSASLTFVPTVSNATASQWDIDAEDDVSGDSAEFTIAPSNLSGRTLTGNPAKLTVPAFVAGEAVETSTYNTRTLTQVVQDVVKNTNWCGGNAMTFIIKDTSPSLAELRQFMSYENDSSSAVKFNYSYTSGTGNCYAATETAQTSLTADDAEQNGSTVTISGTDLSLGTDTVGVRFQGIDVPVDATISEAYILFYAKNTDSSTASFTIKGELPSDGDSDIFTATDNDITGRTLTTGVTWAPDPWDTASEIYQTVDISSIVSQMVKSSANWTSGNDMGFVIEPGSGTRSAESYDSNPAFGPRLRIVYSDTAATAYKTVRERLIEVVDDLPASGSTPITETMYEAALYWRGQNVLYGKSRQSSSTTRLSHPGSYCTKSGSTISCPGATVNGSSPTTDEFGVYTPTGCDPDTNLNDSDCKNRAIIGSPKYVSPFSSELTCQNNYQVLLTDGEANSSGSTVRGNIQSMVGKSSCYTNNSSFKTSGDSSHTYSSDEQCTVDLIEYLRNEDQSTASVGTNLASDQTVRTYTIGFNLGSSSSALANKQFLTDMARKGDGQYFDATTAGSLVDVFNTILTDVKSDPTSFSAPSIAVNTFNRLFSRDDIYFGLFTPALETRWEGNLKKYKLCTDTDPDGVPNSGDECELGVVLDVTGAEAVVDDSTAIDDGEFKTTAVSDWTNSSVAPDGRNVDVGGAGGEITDYTSRIIYTDINNSGTASNGTSLGSTGFKVTATNWTGSDTNLTKVRNTVCPGVDTPPDSACVELMEWMFGKDVEDEDNDGSTTDTRWWFSDILHSSPNVVTYGYDSTNSKYIDKVLVGSNTGGLHFINGDSGIEEWSFIPNDLLAKQSALKTNVTSSHTYGLDTTPTVRAEDADGDGTIESGDKVHVYMAERRGGTSIYGLDISAVLTSATSTTSVVPKFLWRIDAVDNSTGSLASAKGNFSRMGQTWSEPVVADIKISGGTKTVLIFGGGYDDDLDDFDGSGNKKFGLEAGTPNQGNAIYIVDADTGELIFWISHAANASDGVTSSGADILVPDMYYSIASNINVFDSDGDGYADRLYVGDTAGKVWRVDLGSDIDPGGSDPEGSTVVGEFADISVAGTLASERRFFYKPAIVQVRDTTYSNASNGEYDYVVLVTGNRANPLNTDTADRLYAFRDSQTGAMQDSNGDNLADDYPNLIDGTSNSSNPIDNNDLVGITLGSGLTGTTTEKNAEGWYLDFDTTGIAVDGTAGNTDGEKGLSAPRVLFGTILFSTYVPEDTSVVITGADACTAQVGDGRAYNLGILSAAPTLNWDGNSSSTTAADAVQTLGAGGIPPEVVAVFTPEGTTFLFGKEKPGEGAQNKPIRTYWYKEES